MQVIFITYINRSGSTFLANLLSSSEDICVCPEGDAPVKLFLEDPGKSFIPDASFINKIRKSFKQDKKMEAWGIREDAFAYLEKAKTNLQAFIAVLNYYLDQKKPDAKTIVFKAERIAALMNKIHNVDDNAGWNGIKFLSVIRDPRAVYASQAATLAPGTSRSMAKNPVLTAFQWNRYVKQVMSYNETWTNQLLILYEDLIGDMEKCITRISGFLETDAGGINPGKGALVLSLSEEEQKIHELINSPPQVERIDAWKVILHMDKVYLIERTCAKYLSHFGYNRHTSSTRLSLELVRIFRLVLMRIRECFVKLQFYLTCKTW